MITAMKPNPKPDSKTLKARPIGTVGARSPYPKVKKVSPLRYAHVANEGAVCSLPIGAPSDQWNSANDRMSDITHSEKSPNNESGPNMLRKCCFKPRRFKQSATWIHRYQNTR